MNAMISRRAAAILAASLAPAWAGQDALFDTGRERLAAPELLATPANIPQAAGKPVEIPSDLIEAGKRWANAAQAALLTRINPAPKPSFSFAVMGDSEPGRFPWERVFSPGKKAPGQLLRAISGKKLDFVFRLGDMVSTGNAKNYRRHVAFLEKEASLPIFSVIGNHDRSRPNGAADKTLYQVVYGKSDFFIDYNGWRFVGLDTSDRLLRPDQLAWLEQTLATPLRKMIFTHVPPKYLKGKFEYCPPQASPQQPSTQGYWKDVFTGFFDKGSKEFEELVSRHGVERVFMGHIHAFGVADYRQTRYILSGASGSPLYPTPPDMPQCKITHYLEVRAGPGPVSETGHDLDGGEFNLP